MAEPEETMYAVLLADSTFSALTDDVFPQFAPEGASLPYCIYQRISSDGQHEMGNPSTLGIARIQLDSYAATYAGAKALADAARLALDGYFTGGIHIRLLSDQDEYEMPISGQGRGIHRVIADYEVTWQRDI